jgi:molybdate/tungstate transport system substrate-binding protein
MLSLALACSACQQRASDESKPPITVFAAASLARPLRLLADSFTHRTNVLVLAELGGSLEHSRKLTELGRMPDVLMLVDDTVIAALVPSYLDWYVRFATNRMSVAYTARSRYGDSITAENWWRILSRPDVRVARVDSSTAPAGRHALAVFDRAAHVYNEPGLSQTLRSRSPSQYIRPNATELAALLETGEVDYLLDYESVARQYGFQFVSLPADLSPPILYGLGVPRQAARASDGLRFAVFTLSREGQQILRDANINVLSTPVAIGEKVPEEIAALVRSLASSAVPD